MCSLLISTDQLMFVLANLCYHFTFFLQTSFFTIVLKQSDQSKDTDNPLNQSKVKAHVRVHDCINSVSQKNDVQGSQDWFAFTVEPCQS